MMRVHHRADAGLRPGEHRAVRLLPARASGRVQLAAG